MYAFKAEGRIEVTDISPWNTPSTILSQSFMAMDKGIFETLL